MLELAAKVEAASGRDAALGEEVLLACGWRKSSRGYFLGQLFGWSSPDGKSHFDHDHFRRHDPTASVDAALSLVPEGWHVSNFRQHWRSLRWACDLAQLPSDNQIRAYDNGGTFGVQSEGAEAATPALALTAACLKTRAQ